MLGDCVGSVLQDSVTPAKVDCVNSVRLIRLQTLARHATSALKELIQLQGDHV